MEQNNYVILAVKPQHERLTYLHAMNIPGFIMMITNTETNGEIFDIITTGLESRFGSLDNIQVEVLSVEAVEDVMNNRSTALFLAYDVAGQSLWNIPSPMTLLRFMRDKDMIKYDKEDYHE